MTAVLKTKNRLSNFLIREQWADRNYCRSNVPVLLTKNVADTEDFQVGQVVYEDADATGTFKVIDATFDPALDVIGIVVDTQVGNEQVYTIADGQLTPDWSSTSTDTLNLDVLVNGDAEVLLAALYLGTGAVEADVVSALQAVNIKVDERGDGVYRTDHLNSYIKPDGTNATTPTP